MFFTRYLYYAWYSNNDSSNFIELEELEFLDIPNNDDFSDKTKFLLKYGMNETFARVKIKKGETPTIFIKLNNSQSSVSLKNDYKNWMFDKGVSYIKDFKKENDEDKIREYLTKYYEGEAKTLVSEDKDTLPDTTLDLDYFEFVANTIAD